MSLLREGWAGKCAEFRDRSVTATTARGARAIEEVLHGGLRSGVLSWLELVFKS